MDEYKQAIQALPEPLARPLGQLQPKTARQVHEVRLRAGSPVWLNVGGTLCPADRLADCPPALAALRPTRPQLEQALYALCGGSVPTHQTELAEGYLTLPGGHRVGDKGYFYAATLLDDCRQDMDIIHEETFGPVLPIVEFEDTDQVIAWANDVEYGLASSVFTKDIDTAAKVTRGLEFGETYINREHFEAMQGFHAGVKKSGIGGADGKHGVEEYLVTHVTYLDTHYE